MSFVALSCLSYIYRSSQVIELLPGSVDLFVSNSQYNNITGYSENSAHVPRGFIITENAFKTVRFAKKKKLIYISKKTLKKKLAKDWIII